GVRRPPRCPRVPYTTLFRSAALAAHGSMVVMRPGPDGALRPVDISGDWPVRTVHDAVSAAAGERVTPRTPAEDLRALCDRLAVADRKSTRLNSSHVKISYAV